MSNQVYLCLVVTNVRGEKSDIFMYLWRPTFLAPDFHNVRIKNFQGRCEMNNSNAKVLISDYTLIPMNNTEKNKWNFCQLHYCKNMKKNVSGLLFNSHRKMCFGVTPWYPLTSKLTDRCFSLFGHQVPIIYCDANTLAIEIWRYFLDQKSGIWNKSWSRNLSQQKRIIMTCLNRIETYLNYVQVNLKSAAELSVMILFFRIYWVETVDKLAY